jgi:hypothetical protein
MSKRHDVRWTGVMLLAFLLFAAAWPGLAQTQSAAVSPEIFHIDSWSVLAMDRSYLFLRDPGTGSSGLDVLAGVRSKDVLQFLVFEDTDPIDALGTLAEKGLLGNTDVEKAKELLAGQGFSASGKGGAPRDLTAKDLEVLENDPGTTTIGKDFIAEAVKLLSAQAKDGPVFTKSSDCSFLSGVLYFAEQSRQASEKGAGTAKSAKAAAAASGTVSSVLLTQFCASPAGVPPGAPPALPSPVPATVPKPPGPPSGPPVWTNDPCEKIDDQRTCVNGTWQTCICTCSPDRTGGGTWRQTPSSCTGPTPWPPGPCSPPGGYAWCAPGQVCICSPTGTFPAPAPPPPPTPAPTTPPSTGSGEVAAAFAVLTLLAAWIVRRRSRA